MCRCCQRGVALPGVDLDPPDAPTEIVEMFPDVESVVTSAFSEEGGKTRLTATVVYPSVDVRDSVINSGMARGAGISYDRLEDLVAELNARS